MLHVDCECRVLQTIPFRSVLILNKPISGNMLVVKVLVLCCWPAAWRSASRTNAAWVTCLQLCRPELRKRWEMIVHRKFRTANGMDLSTITNQYRQYMQLVDNVPNDLRQECLRVAENDLKGCVQKKNPPAKVSDASQKPPKEKAWRRYSKKNSMHPFKFPWHQSFQLETQTLK